MIRLKNKYKEKAAVVIMGGPSIIENDIDLGLINKDKYTVFLEAKALTPRFLDYGLDPDYYLMSFPEKSKDNQLQHFIYRSFLAKSNIKPLLKPEYLNDLVDMRENFDKYFETWNPVKGPQKRYKWRPNIYLKNSPYDLIKCLSQTKIITRQDLLTHYFPDFKYSNQIHFYEVCEDPESFDLEEYFHPMEQDGKVILRYNTFLNSAAIALYPILNYMGFSEIYFIGMDMSNVGSMEYAAPYIFKSMLHFRWYFMITKCAFNAEYKPNRPFYFRPKSEFDDLIEIFTSKKMKFVRVYAKYKYAASVKNITTISFEQFLQN